MMMEFVVKQYDRRTRQVVLGGATPQTHYEFEVSSVLLDLLEHAAGRQPLDWSAMIGHTITLNGSYRHA
jgi:hypothetical protein